MSKFISLARRELIEHRTGLIYAPAIILTLVLVVVITSLGFGSGMTNANFGGTGNSYTSLGDLLSKLSESEAMVRAGLVGTFLNSISSPAFLILPFVIFFIMLGGLYEERRDRSFLFWKSMPVSDTWEVLARLGAGMILAPLCFLLIGMAAQVIALLIFTVLGAVQGGPVGDLWQVGTILRNWIHMPLFFLMWALWSVPVFAWVLFCGAYAPRAPFMYAILPPLVIMLFEGLYLKTTHFAAWIGIHLTAMPVAEDMAQDIIGGHTVIRGEDGFNFLMSSVAHPDLGVLFTSFGNPDLWIGLLVAAVLVYGAIWLRRYNS